MSYFWGAPKYWWPLAAAQLFFPINKGSRAIKMRKKKNILN